MGQGLLESKTAWSSRHYEKYRRLWQILKAEGAVERHDLARRLGTNRRTLEMMMDTLSLYLPVFEEDVPHSYEIWYGVAGDYYEPLLEDPPPPKPPKPKSPVLLSAPPSVFGRA